MTVPVPLVDRIRESIRLEPYGSGLLQEALDELTKLQTDNTLLLQHLEASREAVDVAQERAVMWEGHANAARVDLEAMKMRLNQLIVALAHIE